MLLSGVVLLCLDEAATNRDRVQFIRADATVKYFSSAFLRIKGPFAVSFYQRNGKRKVIVADRNAGAIRIFLIDLDRQLLLRFLGKDLRFLLVCYRIFGTNDIFAGRAEGHFGRGWIEVLRYLNQGVSRLVRGVELSLFRRAAQTRNDAVTNEHAHNEGNLG